MIELEKRVPLYERLPEIYRVKDAEGEPPFQLRQYLALVEEIFGVIHENIEALYHDLFIETCDEWVIPYIGDLLGTSHLKGRVESIRADVADTIPLRRRKGTLGAIELLTFNLTRWAVHGVELKELLLWNQNLNHQRPDAGGKPPYSIMEPERPIAIRGGTINLRDPAGLSLLNSPFDPYGHTIDLKPHTYGKIGYNIPNLAVFLWRLKNHRIGISKPVSQGIVDLTTEATGDEATFIARFVVHPTSNVMKLFNSYTFDAEVQPPDTSEIDEMPNEIPAARLISGNKAGNPEAYLSIGTYTQTDPDLSDLILSEQGLQMHIPQSEFPDQVWPKKSGPQIWSIRGTNLCAWENGLQPPLQKNEVAIDPVIGRLMVGINSNVKAKALEDHLLLTHTYGSVGDIGAHPISYPDVPETWNDEPVDYRVVDFHKNPNGLRDAMNNIHQVNFPIVIEITDSMTHVLDISTIPTGTKLEDGGSNLQLNRSLIIRAADYQRPIIKLKEPLRFRPTNVEGMDNEEQEAFNAVMNNLTVRLEGLYITRDNLFPDGEPLIARAALHSLEIINCTLDPGGNKKLDGTLEGTRYPIKSSMSLDDTYGFKPAEATFFQQTPEIIIQRCMTGPLYIDQNYQVTLTESILDAGSRVNDRSEIAMSGTAMGQLTDISGIGTVKANLLIAEGIKNIVDFLETNNNRLKDILGNVDVDVMKSEAFRLISWAATTQIDCVTVFGRMLVRQINGKGSIWVHALQVLNNQVGCIRHSYFSGINDRLPQNHACVTGVKIAFTSEIFGEPAYGQLHRSSDFNIRERGPNDDAMGAFAYLYEAHKWRNLKIRYRAFMPAGITPILIPVN